MAQNTLNNRTNGSVIDETYFNDIHLSLNGDFVGRGATGVPTAGQNLGSVSIPWGTLRSNSVVVNGQAIDPALVATPQNIVLSGKMRASSNQPAFLVPSGSTTSVTLDGSPTSLVFDVNGSTVTLSADIVKSSLTTAPASNNTCLVNDTLAVDQASTRTWGEYDAEIDYITVDTMGSNITALIGKYAAFKLDNGGATEYFIAFVESATKLSHCFRGYFYDSSANPKNRIVFSNNDTITLMSWGHLFIENNATTVDVTYSVPTYSTVAPSGPVTGDYWSDLANGGIWKRYDGAAFQIINRTFIGSVVIDTTACVAARCADFYYKYNNANNLLPRFSTTSIARVKDTYGAVSVKGRLIQFGNTRPQWNITTDRASTPDSYSATEDNSTPYYLYVADTGATIMSDISPYYRPDLSGSYHPHNPWRCVGIAWNNASGDIQTVSFYDPFHTSPEVIISRADDNDAGQSFADSTETTVQFSSVLGSPGADRHDKDPFGILDESNYRMVAPIPGYYDLDASLLTASTTATFGGYLIVRKNGSDQMDIQYATKTGTANQGVAIQLFSTIWLNVGDYIEMRFLQASGGSLALLTVGSAVRPNTLNLKYSRGQG